MGSMESGGFKSLPDKKGEEVSSVLEKAGRVAVFATALTGVTATLNTPAEAAPTLTQYEQKELFSSEREAEAFLKHVASMDVGIDDARGRIALRMKVVERFTVFALSLDQKKSYMSRGDTAMIDGVLTPKAKHEAAQLLMFKLERSNDHSPGIYALRQLVRSYAFDKQTSQASDTHNQEQSRGAGMRQEGHTTQQGASEVRRSSNFDNF